MLELADVAPLDRAKAESACQRFQLREVQGPDDPAFGAAYDMLASFFLAQGELEERDALAGFLRQRVLTYSEGVDGTYHLVTAWEGERLAGVRDCYVDLDRHLGVSMVALAHAFVAPEYRRTGLAALLRALPVTLARRIQQERLGKTLPTLLIAEMDPADPERPDSVVRLLAYGRSGFSVLDPQRMRYSQPELRELPDAAYTGLPLLGVVRPVGLEQIPVEVAGLFPRLFHTTHRMYLPDARVTPSEQHARAHLDASPEPVPLLPLPTDTATLQRLRPLVRGAILPLYPPGLRGPAPHFGDPEEEMATIVAHFPEMAIPERLR
jgi:GNAT superfamily N-acetyltransferase